MSAGKERGELPTTAYQQGMLNRNKRDGHSIFRLEKSLKKPQVQPAPDSTGSTTKPRPFMPHPRTPETPSGVGVPPAPRAARPGAFLQGNSSDTHTKPSLAQPEAVTSHPISCQLRKEPLLSLQPPCRQLQE